MPDLKPVAEGADFDEYYRPLRVILFGSQFAAVDDAGAMGISATGHNPVTTLAQKLLQMGFDPDRPMILYRANQRIGATTVGEAAQ